MLTVNVVRSKSKNYEFQCKTFKEVPRVPQGGTVIDGNTGIIHTLNGTCARDF